LQQQYLEDRQCREADHKLYGNKKGHSKKQQLDYSANQKNQEGTFT